MNHALLSRANKAFPLVFMFEKGIYPDSWTRGIIVPVPKKGNLNDANNYRGITLTSIFSKIFSIYYLM